MTDQPGMFFLDDRTDSPEIIRVGSACVIRPFGSGFVVAGGDGRLEVLAVSSTLEGAIAVALAEPEYDRGDEPDWQAAVADDLRTLRRAIDRTKETLSSAGNDRVPNDAVYEALRSAVDDLAALRDDAAQQQTAPRAEPGARAATLETRAQELVKKPTTELLNRLAMEYGMSWSGIARAIGVSVQAIRKWRHSGSISIENKRSLAKIVATLDILEKQIEDPAGWLEIPVLEGYSLRHLDLLARKDYQILLDLVTNFITPGDVLQSINPNWRTEMSLKHEVFIAEDGQPAIRRR